MGDKWGRPLKDEHYGIDPKDVAADKPDVGKPEHHTAPEPPKK